MTVVVREFFEFLHQTNLHGVLVTALTTHATQDRAPAASDGSHRTRVRKQVGRLVTMIEIKCH